MTNLKCVFEVQAGLIPGVAEAEFARRWFYTWEDYHADLQGLKDNPGPDAQANRFTAMLVEARDYMTGIVNPQRVNWARLDWIWYY